LTIGSEKIHVAILKNDALMEGNKIVASILDLSALRSSADQLYLAAPRLLGTAIDADVFRSHGIGLLLFDDRRIQEVVPARQIRPPVGPIVQNPDQGIASELATLKSMYTNMERTISNLREELKSFREITLSRPTPSQRIIPAPPGQTAPRFIESEGELPSFFANNPWVEVLSKRGREATETLAA
jgi:hypothetical protein